MEKIYSSFYKLKQSKWKQNSQSFTYYLDQNEINIKIKNKKEERRRI
jgi:hypothetical protein